MKEPFQTSPPSKKRNIGEGFFFLIFFDFFSHPNKIQIHFYNRYIYLWINYAVYEELIATDIPRAREVFKACLGVIPHKKFSFSKIWIMFAEFEIRQKDLVMARKIFGNALGQVSFSSFFFHFCPFFLSLPLLTSSFLPSNTYTHSPNNTKKKKSTKLTLT